MDLSGGRKRGIGVRVCLGYMGFIGLSPLTETGFYKKIASENRSINRCGHRNSDLPLLIDFAR